MSALLLANAAATLVMVGVAWFVQVVHYPLFAMVGRARFGAYHEAHSRRTGFVVIAPMTVELVSSIWLVFQPPLDRGGEPMSALVIAGAVLAVATWVVTFAWSVPEHERLGTGFEDRAHRSLRASNLTRTIAWSAHGAVVVAMLATVG